MEFNADLPALPKGWVWTRVGEIYDIVGGGTPSTKVDEYWIGDMPWITSADILGLKDIRPRKYINKEAIEDSATNLVPKSSLIIVTRVVLGKVALTKYSLCFSQDCQALIGKNFQPYPDYSIYYLSQAVQIFKYQHRGTTISGVTKKQLSELLFALPPLPEQYRIVNKIEELFTKLDAGVDALKKIKIQLKRYRQAVLKNAFEGKLTQQWREAHKGDLEPASVLLEKIKEQRTKESKGKFNELPPIDTSELPELPEGWVWTRVGEISIKIHYGYTASAKENNVGPKLLRITDIQNNSVNWNSVPYCKIDNFEREKYLLNEGDLVFARTGATVGKSFLLKGDVPEAVFASYLIRTIINNSISKKYVFQFFQSNFYWDQIQKVKVGIGQPNVNAQLLSRLLIPLPPIAEQHQIVAEIESRLSVADQLEKVVEQSFKQAERLRKSILKQAFEGKLVPQDPTDEPADKLLERIKEEKESRNLIKQKSRRKK
jgi:type I restriction enzyme S subunit